MDQAGDHLLAGSGLAADEDAGVGVGDATDSIEHRAHGRVLSDHRRLGGVTLAGLARLEGLQGAAQDLLERRGMERLGQEVGGASPQRVDGVQHRGLRGQHHHRHRRCLSVRLAQDGVTIELRDIGAGQPDVGEAQVESAGTQPRHRLGAVECQHGLVPETGQEIHQRGLDGGVTVDQKYSSAH